MTGPSHNPVLLAEIIAALAPVAAAGATIIDATFGAGGYAAALLATGATVHAFDRDPDALHIAQGWEAAHANPPQLIFHPRRFSEMAQAINAVEIAQVDGIVMDIGVSSMQLDEAARGFAFSLDGPLDMRMAQTGASAGDFVNTAAEAEIADVLYLYGEERQSRRIARAIVAARPLATTGALASVVRRALGHHPGQPKDPATRSFQAIRIHINDELAELRAGLAAAEALLRPGGRLVVVSFHSLEDRIVKTFLRDAAGGAGASRHLPATAGPRPTFADVARAQRPGAAELARNPRARSATLRIATRTDAPARHIDPAGAIAA